MTETEKREFVRRMNTQFSKLLDDKAQEFRKSAIIGQMMALQSEIASADELEKLYVGAQKLQVILTGQQVLESLALAGASSVAGPVNPTIQPGELP